MSLSGVWDFFTKDLVGSRKIFPTEMGLAHEVFRRTLPDHGQISISPQLVDGNAMVEKKLLNNYTIYLGPKGYTNARSTAQLWDDRKDKVVEVFIHEMTHVWQFHHGINVWFEGIKVHINRGEYAYIYTAGESWESYNIEQQAQIVQDWFADGMKENHENYPYIRDCIRQGKTKGRYQRTK